MAQISTNSELVASQLEGSLGDRGIATFRDHLGMLFRRVPGLDAMRARETRSAVSSVMGIPLPPAPLNRRASAATAAKDGTGFDWIDLDMNENIRGTNRRSRADGLGTWRSPVFAKF